MSLEAEPTLRQVRDELKADLKHDERLRAVEVEQAVTRTSLDGLRLQVGAIEELQRSSRAEILAAIEAAKPKPVWPAVSAVVAAVALILVVAQALYGQ
jgi:hypothetical protein